MPEQVVAPSENAPAAIDPAIKTELDQQMAISLNGGIAPESNKPAADDAGAAPAAPATPVDPFGILKEKFGYDTPEVAVQEIEALRTFRAAPPRPELNFENELSKNIVEALQAGKLNDVHDILDKQIKIDRLTSGEMTADTAAEIVKLGMQMKYKDLTPAEIAYKFNKQYALPAKPGLLPAEDQEEYNARVAAWEAQVQDRQMELMIDAKLARPELLSSKTKLVFPTIARPEQVEFQEWQKTVQENDRLAAETTEAYKAFTPKSIETNLHFVDKENKIDFVFNFEPDPESFGKAIEMANDINIFWKHFINPDGTPDRQRFLRTMYNGLNHEKILTAALNQSKNAAIKAGLPDNSSGGLVRQLPPTQEPNELDTLMRASLKGYGGF